MGLHLPHRCGVSRVLIPVDSSLTQFLNTPGVIVEVWRALGGGELRNGRSRAFWRDGNGLNISLDSECNRWYDFVSCEGGGILKLIEIALGCSKFTATRWLANFSGIDPAEECPEQRRHRIQIRRIASGISAAAALWIRAVSVLIERRYRSNLNALYSAWHLGCLDSEFVGQELDAVMARYGRLLYVLRGDDPEYVLRLYLAMLKMEPETTRAMVQWGRTDIEDADAWARQVTDWLANTSEPSARSDVA